MIVPYFVLWLILMGRVTPETVLLGLLLSLALDLFVRRILRTALPSVSFKRLFRLLPEALLYLANLVVEILRANLALIRLILARDIEVEPCLVRFRTPLKSTAARVALADSITLTPGTITVGLKDDELLVHAINRKTARQLSGSSLERELLEMEGHAHD